MFVLCGVSKRKLLVAWRHDSLMVLQASVAFRMKHSSCLCLAAHNGVFAESTPGASLCGSKCLGHKERFCHVSCHKLHMLCGTCLTFESQLHLSQWDRSNPNSAGNDLGCFVQCSLSVSLQVTATSCIVTVWWLTDKCVCLLRQQQILQQNQRPSSRRQGLWTLRHHFHKAS